MPPLKPEIVEPLSPETESGSAGSLQQGLALASEYLTQSVKPSTRNQVLPLLFLLLVYLCIVAPCNYCRNWLCEQFIYKSIFVFQYARVYHVWTNFCAENNLPEFEAGHEALAACLSLVMKKDCSLSKVTMLSAAIANEHRIRLKPSPTTHESISKLFRGFKLSQPSGPCRTPKLPFTEEHIRQLIDKLREPAHGPDSIKASVVLWRTVWRVVIEYHTLGRFSDVARLTRREVIFCNNPSKHLQITFRGGKNDLFSEGGLRIVAGNLEEPRYCPVELTAHYFRFLGSAHLGYLVPACTPTNKPDPLKALPYHGALSDLRSLLTSLGFDAQLYGEHSGKRGAATQAAENGMDSDSLQRLGGWRSEQMAAKYVDQSTESKIKLSKMLQKRL